MDNHTEIALINVKNIINGLLNEAELRLVSNWADEKRYAMQRELASRFK